MLGEAGKSIASKELSFNPREALFGFFSVN
jgi:hypothetical protein